MFHHNFWTMSDSPIVTYCQSAGRCKKLNKNKKKNYVIMNFYSKQLLKHLTEKLQISIKLQDFKNILRTIIFIILLIKT